MNNDQLIQILEHVKERIQEIANESIKRSEVDTAYSLVKLLEEIK